MKKKIKKKVIVPIKTEIINKIEDVNISDWGKKHNRGFWGNSTTGYITDNELNSWKS